MDGKKLNVLFIGTSSEYAMKPLRQIEGRHILVGVVESVARPDDLPGRKRKSIYDLNWQMRKVRNSLSLFALQRNLPFLSLSSENMDDLRQMIFTIQPDVCCVASMNQLIPPDILQIPPKGFINFHPSMLPKLRGPFVWFWYYHQNEREGGATIHFLDAGEDTGDILRQESFDIYTGMPPELLVQQTIDIGARLIVEALDDIASGTVERREQRHLSCPKRARYLQPDDELFDWQQWTLEHTFHFLSGCYPWYESFKRPVWLPSFYTWRAVDYQEMSTNEPFGAIRPDKRGFYFCHPQGKIRLKLILNPYWSFLLLAFILALINLITNR